MKPANKKYNKGKISSTTDVNYDGWKNVVTRINTSNSRVGTYKYGCYHFLSRQELTDIYCSYGIGRRIVDTVVDDSIREFIDADPKLIKELNRIKSKQCISDAACMARLFGGSLLVAYIDDGQEMDKPLNYNNIRKLIKLQVFDRYYITWSNDDLSRNFYDEFYGEPLIYTIIPINGIPFKVHRSRCHRFNGDRLPLSERAKHNYWDMPVLQPAYEALRNYGSVNNATAEIVQDFIQTILCVEGLEQLLVQGDEDKIVARANLIDTVRSITNTIFLDAGSEKYEKHASSVAGLGDLWDRFSESICAATGIPISKLFGRSAKGLNANTHNDLDNWNSIVQAYRVDELEPPIDWLIKILEAQMMWDKNARPINYEWSFPCLETTSEEESAKVRLITAQADQIYIDRGAVDPEILFNLRHANGEFHTNILIDQNVTDNSLFEENEIDDTDQEIINLIENKPVMEIKVKTANVDKVETVEEETLRFDEEKIEILKQKLYKKLDIEHHNFINIDSVKEKLYKKLISTL